MARTVGKAEMRVVSERSAAEQIEELLGAREDVPLSASRSVTVRELSIADIAPIAVLIEPLYEAFFTGGNIHAIIAQRLEDAIVLAVTASPLSSEELRALPAGKFTAVVAASVRVNSDFFVQSARLRDAVVAMVGAMFGDGATSSTSSASTGT